MFQHGGHIACNEIFPLPQSDNQGAFLPRGNKAVGIILAEHAERVASLQLADGLLHGLKDIAVFLVIVIDEVGNNFRIRLAAEHNALALQPFLKRGIIFNDAVVHHRYRAAFIYLRMGIYIARFAMRRPARVADAEGTTDQLRGNPLLQKFDGALHLADNDVFARIHRNAGAVIAAILKLF